MTVLMVLVVVTVEIVMTIYIEEFGFSGDSEFMTGDLLMFVNGHQETLHFAVFQM